MLLKIGHWSAPVWVCVHRFHVLWLDLLNHNTVILFIPIDWLSFIICYTLYSNRLVVIHHSLARAWLWDLLQNNSYAFHIFSISENQKIKYPYRWVNARKTYSIATTLGLRLSCTNSSICENDLKNKNIKKKQAYAVGVHICWAALVAVPGHWSRATPGACFTKMFKINW